MNTKPQVSSAAPADAGQPTKLSPAQRRRLEQAVYMLDRGNYSATWACPNGLGRAAIERACTRLCELGLMKPYAHGGYTVTDSGRAALASDAKP